MNPEDSAGPDCEGIFLQMEDDPVVKKSYVRDRRPSMKNLLIFESKIYFFTNTIALMPPFFFFNRL
tara:strand:- start:130 stop:327 length:198 start_codon:yes stop_codon:yes gene_type:complete